MNNLLSFDLEYGHTREFIDNSNSPNSDSKASSPNKGYNNDVVNKSGLTDNKTDKGLAESPTNAILALLRKHNTKATFFVVRCVHSNDHKVFISNE